jgi:hypothetical protein
MVEEDVVDVDTNVELVLLEIRVSEDWVGTENVEDESELVELAGTEVEVTVSSEVETVVGEGIEVEVSSGVEAIVVFEVLNVRPLVKVIVLKGFITGLDAAMSLNLE